MVHVDIQRVVVILAATHTVMGYIVHIMGIITELPIITVVMEPVCVLVLHILLLLMEKIIIVMEPRMKQFAQEGVLAITSGATSTVQMPVGTNASVMQITGVA